MNLQTKRCLRFLGIGTVVGLLALAVFVVALVTVSKGSPVHASITSLFAIVNKPLELIPWLDFLAERQDPILSIGFIAVYWAAIGILIGGVAFAILGRWTPASGSSGVSHEDS